ncbi:MAG: thioredoxin family protein [Candidatus Altiarchaeota archaeon]|nr:thioredoxin family protein [Candidatus Altiarchaeota archaeon]
MKAILYTAVKCPKCPAYRKLLREAAKELDLVEGRDYVEKLIDGESVKPGKIVLDGQEYNIVESAEDVKETPAAVCGDNTIEALQYQVASTPAIVIDDELAFIGDLPGKEELKEKLKG